MLLKFSYCNGKLCPDSSDTGHSTTLHTTFQQEQCNTVRTHKNSQIRLVFPHLNYMLPFFLKESETSYFLTQDERADPVGSLIVVKKLTGKNEDAIDKINNAKGPEFNPIRPYGVLHISCTLHILNKYWPARIRNNPVHKGTAPTLISLCKILKAWLQLNAKMQYSLPVSMWEEFTNPEKSKGEASKRRGSQSTQRAALSWHDAKATIYYSLIGVFVLESRDQYMTVQENIVLPLTCFVSSSCKLIMASEAFKCGRQQIYLHSILCWRKDHLETTTVRRDDDAIKLNLWWVYLIMRHTQQICIWNLRCNYSSAINIQEALSYSRCHYYHRFKSIMHGLSPRGAPSYLSLALSP